MRTNRELPRAARRAAVCLGAALLGLALAPAGLAPADVPVLPRPARFVTDTAGVLGEARTLALNEKLAQLERETSSQVVVYVGKRIPEGTTLEELANRAFRAWGIGQKGKSNGVLYLVFVEDRGQRIEVGYGLEGALTDARSSVIQNEIVTPLFKSGDYAAGIEAGVEGIVKAVRGESYKGTGRTVATEKKRIPWQLVFFVVFFVVPILVGRRGRYFYIGGGGFGGGGFGGGLGGGGFSGGGGSSGGGGASGRW